MSFDRGEGIVLPTIGPDGYVPIAIDKMKHLMRRFAVTRDRNETTGKYGLKDKMYRGVKMLKVTYGTDKDTSIGYIYQRFATIGDDKVYTRRATLSKRMKFEAKFEFLGNAPNPTAQWVTFQPPNHKMIRVRPCVFLAMMADLDAGKPVDWDMTFESESYQNRKEAVAPAADETEIVDPDDLDTGEDDEESDEWLARDDQYIMDNYKNTTYAVMAENLDVEEAALKEHMKADLDITRATSDGKKHGMTKTGNDTPAAKQE